jgi:hypothetical protein
MMGDLFELLVLAVEQAHVFEQPPGQRRMAPGPLRLGQGLVCDLPEQVGAEGEFGAVEEEQILDDEPVQRVGRIALRIRPRARAGEGVKGLDRSGPADHRGIFENRPLGGA